MNSSVQHSLITMRVGLVVDDIEIRSGTGIARYAGELLRGLAGKGWDATPISVPHSTEAGGRIFAHMMRLPWKVLRLGGRSDIVHATAPITAISFPLIRQPKVVTFHDLISLLYRHGGTSLHARFALPPLFRIAAKSADQIIVVSSQTRQEILTYSGADPSRITVIPLGVSDEFQCLPRKESGIFTIGYVGHMRPRKRLDLLIRAFHLMVQRNPEIPARLAIHGPREWDFPRLLSLAGDLGILDRINFPGFADDRSLPKIYRSFHCFIMPSDWEGFGLPILEAQRCGVPVIIRTDARIPEEVARYCVKASTVEDIAEQMARVITDPEYARNIAQQALTYSNQFTWDRTVQETIAVYERAL
jgi:glycosyltransferase involved in cell wall biosynthesis